MSEEQMSVTRSLYIDDELSSLPGLKGKSILVTGAGSGIGRSASLILASSGAKLTLADRDEVGGQETEDSIRKAGGTAKFVRTDVASEASVQDVIAAAVKLYGRLDGAFNNAGIPQFGEFHNTSGDEFRRVLTVNLTGVFHCMKHEIIEMLRVDGGAIVNTSSLAGIAAFGDNAAYCASKFGVVGLTLTAAHDYGDRGIRANVLCPGLTRTPMVEAAVQEGENERMLQRTRQIPFGRAGEPRELGQAAAWLLSDGASYLSGVVLPVDGGLMAGPYYKA
jgi:NAD(P)-dependent dehydrogenase (short-subunit alcohol dehydrogenase family)